MRKILIATPEKSLVSRHYVQSAIEISSFLAIHRPDYECCVRFCSGTSVNFARNELAQAALEGDFDDLVFIDSDMGKWGKQFLRLLEHDVPIVGGLYTSKTLTATPWLAPLPGAKVDPVTGLLPSLKIATGFMRIKVKEVLPALQKAYPESAYFGKVDAGKPIPVLHEYFPMGIVGPGTPTAKVAEIRKLVSGLRNEEDRFMDSRDVIVAIESVLQTSLPGNLLGEDYYFCHRCIEAGIPIFADSTLLIPHFDYSTEYPSDPQKIIALAEKLKAQQ